MLLLGIDVGTSSIKVSVVDAQNGQNVASASYPDKETEIIAKKAGWAEQSPDLWWHNVQQAILKCNASGKYKPKDIAAIGIAYQMHGLVLVNQQAQSVRNSIIWCDSRAVDIGNKAFEDLGKEFCLAHYLNSPGNFTASKLAWVKQNEPEVFETVQQMMLPGDFIALKLTGEATTSVSALSEGVLWDFEEGTVSYELLKYYGIPESFIPKIKPVFATHGLLDKEVAQKLGLQEGVAVSYKAGDQPNNALSLNVTEPGEVASTAGTSGVIYGVTDQLLYDPQSRVNTFAHVSHSAQAKRLGVLLCINGTGSLNRWTKSIAGDALSYTEINQLAAGVAEGSEGLSILPFGNGAERMLNNKLIGAQFSNIDFNIHTQAHLFRAAQEGIAFAFRYGFDILKENGMQASVIKAGKANLFLSDVFAQSFVNITGVPVELYNNDGSHGAAIGAGIGAGIFASAADAFASTKPLQLIEPQKNNLEEAYESWKNLLKKQLS
ncbi:carbohydrate kinase [Pelobium manganitolerans]|uniref:Carbohydrate kinase n=1 Tax=Pelobium manganitolerans TaxID=1842495 RepID=A0A419SBX8_9SPHI|nr:FGGY family carbohydrate kinase [Pelobium manganitolerans]RKD20332.1 carbohydrate kinase [Pelobium manganitolerans]